MLSLHLGIFAEAVSMAITSREKIGTQKYFKLPHKKTILRKLHMTEHELFLQQGLVLVSLHLSYL